MPEEYKKDSTLKAGVRNNNLPDSAAAAPALSDFTHGGNIYFAARNARAELSEILDFSANINPLGMAASVQAAVTREMVNLIHYPDAEAVQLKAAISDFYQVEQSGITVGNGAVELLYVLCHVRRPQRVLVTAPTFNEYERASLAAGAAVEYFFLSPAEDFVIAVQALAERLSGIDIVFICNPNNPTGALLTAEQLELLLQRAAQTGTMVVVDESFQDFLAEKEKYSCRRFLSKYPHLLLVHSLTKFYAIPGLRLGFTLSAPVVAKTLALAKDPWNVNSLAQAAGVAALADNAYQSASRELMAAAAQKFYRQLAALPGCHPYQPTVNYILLNIAGCGLSSTQLSQAMAARGVLVRDCANYPGLSTDYVRLAVKLPAQNEVLLRQLTAVLTRQRSEEI